MLRRKNMLLLFLCLFFHYDFLHCVKEKDNFKDGFLDYSITEFWWNGTPGIDQTDRITPQYSFMPTPYGHGKFVGDDGVVYDVQADSPPEPTASSEEIKTFTPFPNMTRVSFPFSVDEYTVVGPSLPPRPPPMPSPWHINYPGLTPPPNFPSDYRYPTVYPTMHDPREYSPSPTGPTPRRPSFTLPSVSRPKLTYPTLFTTSTSLPPETWPSVDRVTTTPEPETSPVSWDPAAAYIKMWKEKLTSDAAAGTTPLDMMPKLRGIFNYDYTTEELSLALRRGPSMSRRELKKSQKVTVDAILARRERRSENKAPSYDPDNLDEAALEHKRTKHTQTLTAATMPTQGTDLLSESMATTEAKNTDEDDDIKETREGNGSK